jgi:sugar lactone lactonase YvrE
MNEREPALVADCRCHTGEGPLWHPDDEMLYWTDIPNGLLYRYDPVHDEYERWYETNAIGGFTIQEDGSLLLFEDDGHIEQWQDGSTKTIVSEIERERNSRFNDVIADPHGRVFCGTMPTESQLGRLYRLDTDGTITCIGENWEIPNGMGFSPSLDTLYVTESAPGYVYAFEYDEATGQLSNREVVLDVSDETGIPDGLTVDEDGYLWSARWNGGCLVRYAPDGTELQRIDFPARKVSSVTFGNENYDCAYVTTALGPGEGPAGERDAEGDGAGAVFGLCPETGGVPEYRSRIGT